MKNRLIFLITVSIIALQSKGQDVKGRVIQSLNGQWQFEQTINAFPPMIFSGICPVPGLIHLAQPLISDYDKFFQRPDKVDNKDSHNLLEMDYVPKYSWYKKIVFIPDSLREKEVVLTIRKSQYVTQVYVNGMDVGGSISCYTPIVIPVSQAIHFGSENEILIRVGDRAWLPSQAAGSVDKEKMHYLPGIWDDVYLTYTGKFFIQDLLVIPSVVDSNALVKLRIRNFFPAQVLYGDRMYDSCMISLEILEKTSGRKIAGVEFSVQVKRDNITIVEKKIHIQNFNAWTPDSPFLYFAEARVSVKDIRSDRNIKAFGMRDFRISDRHFQLNGKQIFLRGTNITLHRFFEDPDCQALPWDREWVKKMLIDIPKSLHWNAMRICVGIVPDFWYDLADEYGMMFQDEWMYWQNHGWDEQVRNEYTDWVWSDGNHPGIVIWDAINENWDSFIGKQLIPELKILDPSRVWDAGYMSGQDMSLDEMDEPHPYRAGWDLMNSGNGNKYFREHPYLLGKLDDRPASLDNMFSSHSAQLVNEYGWIWLWRDGRPAKLTKLAYDYFLGENATPGQRRELQAYWTQLETEWLRSERSLAGVLAFCYLANNYGFTGDWFIHNIKDLEAGPSLKWMKHSFSPAAVFIDLPDERYIPFMPVHHPGEVIEFKLAGINDLPQSISGKISLKLINSFGKTISEKKSVITLAPYGRSDQKVSLKLPASSGGYLVLADFQTAEYGHTLSRRYIRVGNPDPKKISYFEITP